MPEPFSGGGPVAGFVSRAARVLTASGLCVTIVGLAVALLFGDRFVGMALFVVGAFLIILPLSRPSLDED